MVGGREVVLTTTLTVGAQLNSMTGVQTRSQAPLVYTIQHSNQPAPQAAFSVSSTPLDSPWMYPSLPSATGPSQTVPTSHVAAPGYL